MSLNYEDLEHRFNCACQDVVQELSVQYKSDYQSGGPGRLTAFLDLIKKQFDEVEGNFIKHNGISEDHEALRRIKGIAKMFAKRCVDDYGKIL